MKLTPEILRDFLAILPQYDRLSVADRRALASIERPSQSCSYYVLRDSLQALIAAGFLLPPAPNGRCSVEPSRQEFIRTLRVLRGHPVFQSPSQASFSGYLEDHLNVAEREALRAGCPAAYGERNLVLYRQISMPGWLEDFLNANPGEWERPYLRSVDRPLFASAELSSRAKDLIRWLMTHGRTAMRDLPGLAQDPATWSETVHACLRYALLFAVLDSDTMDVMVGIWPGITADLAMADMPPPQCVVPAETFSSFFLVDDMTALLVACATEPLRLRATDLELFAKTSRDLAATLRPLPKWVDEAFDMDPEIRLDTTVTYVRSFRLVEEEYPRTHMAISEEGREWLGLPMGDRLRVVMDGILSQKQSVPAFHDFEGTKIGASGSEFYVSTTMKPPPDIPAAIMQPFQSLQGDGFYPIEEILAFSRSANPLLKILRKDPNAYFGASWGSGNSRDPEYLKTLWDNMVRGFLRTRLLPMGGVRLGRSKEGVSIAITPAGRYYLGQTRKWEWWTTTDSQVIVQPNFEVTFLGEAAAAEAEIGRFAERRGRQIGALFQITKKSIFAAAAAGMTATDALAILERVCTREVPANVRREIQGWFAQCKKVSLESVILIRCPDHETALRVLGLAKNSATALSDTILEYRDPDGKQRPGLIKKLKEMGVLVSVLDSALPRERQWRSW